MNTDKEILKQLEKTNAERQQTSETINQDANNAKEKKKELLS